LWYGRREYGIECGEGWRGSSVGGGAREGNGARHRPELRRASSWWSWWLVVDVAMVDRGGGGGTVVGSVS